MPDVVPRSSYAATATGLMSAGISTTDRFLIKKENGSESARQFPSQPSCHLLVRSPDALRRKGAAEPALSNVGRGSACEVVSSATLYRMQPALLRQRKRKHCSDTPAYTGVQPRYY